MKRVIRILLVPTVIVFFGCSQKDLETTPNMADSKIYSTGNTHFDEPEGKEMDVRVQEQQNGVTYKIDLVTAVDFIARKGERVANEDLVHLQKESVLILEIQINETVKNILESSKLKMSKDDAVSYLLNEVKNDMSIQQNNESLKPYEVLYDGNLSGANKLRVFLFFNDVDVTSTVLVQFYDRLFGAGLINLKH